MAAWRLGLGSTLLACGLALASSGAAEADELRAPRNVKVEPSTPQSAALTTRAAIAAMNGNPEQARDLANEAIRADPRDPWTHYNKGMALAQLGETDAALAALFAAEARFSKVDRWGRSVAIYGRAHTLSRAGRCAEAVEAYAEYASFVAKDDPRSAEMARSYAMHCRTPAPAASAAPAAPATPAAPGAPKGN
jgi:tetratricopeptide (TPR) repeat protein